MNRANVIRMGRGVTRGGAYIPPPLPVPLSDDAAVFQRLLLDEPQQDRIGAREWLAYVVVLLLAIAASFVWPGPWWL